MMEDCVLLGSLTVFAWIDIKKREFPLPLLGACAAAGVAFFLVTGQPTAAGLIGGVCVGGTLLLCALLSRESVGLGDGLLLCITGLYLGLWGNLVLLFLAAVFCAAAGAVLMIAKKYTRKQSLPFAPFVLLSDVALLALMM